MTLPTITKSNSITTMNIDVIDLLYYTRVLLVIFIILICLINFLILFKQIRKVRFYQSPKLMIIISLAIGDIMMALFPLVVMAKLVFEPRYTVECRTTSAYITYFEYLLHFVYGLGLIALGIEVLIRSKLRSLCSPSVTAVVMGGVPWFLGLIIILPLCMAKMDYYNCVNHESMTSMYTVSVFVPASLAVILLIIFNCIRLPVDQQQHQRLNDSDFQPTIINSQQVVALQETMMPSNNTESNLNETRLNYPQAEYPYVQNPASLRSHFPYQPYPQYPPNQQGVSRYPPYHQGVSQYPPMHQGQVMNNTNQIIIVHQPGNTVCIPDMRRTELQRLLIISIIFFLMVVPYAAIIVSTWGVALDSYTLFIAGQVLNWLMVARSCVTPLIMSFYSDL